MARKVRSGELTAGLRRRARRSLPAGRRPARPRPGCPGTRCPTGPRSERARCRHNLAYWTGGDWWGIGPGAHSHVGGVRWWNVKHPAGYAAALAGGRSPAQAREVLDDAARREERILLELRLVDGLDLEAARPTGRRGQARLEVAGRAAGPGRARRGPGGADQARPTAGRRHRAPADRLTLSAGDAGGCLGRSVSLPRDRVARRSAAGVGSGCRTGAAAQMVEVEDPDVDDGALLQRRPQRPVQAVLQVDLALPRARRAGTGRRRRWSPRRAGCRAAVHAWWRSTRRAGSAGAGSSPSRAVENP